MKHTGGYISIHKLTHTEKSEWLQIILFIQILQINAFYSYFTIHQVRMETEAYPELHAPNTEHISQDAFYKV